MTHDNAMHLAQTMETKLTWQYDTVGDILYISKTPPYAEQEEDELQEGVIARFHPEAREIESQEILFFANRLNGVIYFNSSWSVTR